MFDNTYFGIVLSFVVFELAKKLNSKIHNGILRSIFNPLLVSIIVISAILHFLGVPYEVYNKGGSLISFFIGPATVALMVSLYDNIDILKKNYAAIFIGILIGSFVSMLLTIVLARVLKVDELMIITLLPESVTTAIAVSLAGEYGGIAPLAAIAVIIRGIIGIIVAPIIMKIFKINDPVAQGIGLGTAAHALGTAEAREMGDVQGAMGGLSIAVAGIMTVALVPLMVLILNAI